MRSFPGSRRHPQYGKDALAASLRERAIEYVWLPALGGRRRAAPNSPNTAWRNAAFRGYADHMATAEFAQGLQQLLELARGARTVIMCAEALWWRCHRSMIADALTARGVAVEHIMSAAKSHPHQMTSFARVEGPRVTYPAENLERAGEAADLVRQLSTRYDGRVRVLFHAFPLASCFAAKSKCADCIQRTCPSQ